jgi:hypothetical protein
MLMRFVHDPKTCAIKRQELSDAESDCNQSDGAAVDLPPLIAALPRSTFAKHKYILENCDTVDAVN